MTDEQAQVDALVAQYRRNREHLAGVHRELAAIRASASSTDGVITATVSSKGTLTDLTISEQAYSRYRPEHLAEQIVKVVAVATTEALTRTSEVLAPALPSGTDPKALLLGTGDLDASDVVPEQTQKATPETVRPESAKPAPREDVVDDDEDFDQHNWVAEGWGKP